MAVYDVAINMFESIGGPQVNMVNNSGTDLEVYAWRDSDGSPFTLESTLSMGMNEFRTIVLFAPNNTPMFIYTKDFVIDYTPKYSVMYINSNGVVGTATATNTALELRINGLSDTPSPGGLSTLHIDDTRVEQINYNNKSYTSFPVDIPLVPNVKTMTVIGKTFNVQLDNELNIVRVKDGQTEYRQFPATIMVGANKTLQLYGKEDPEITIDYTGTQDPVISNTPATPPPVV